MKKRLSLLAALILTLGVLAAGVGSVSAAIDASDGKMYFYAFENPGEFGGNQASAIYMCKDQSVYNKATEALGTMNSDHTASGGYAVVTLNGTAYRIEHYANMAGFTPGSGGGSFFRFNIQEKGATVISGLQYRVKLEIYDKSGKLVITTAEETVVSGMTSSNFDDQRPGLNVDTDTSGFDRIDVINPKVSGITPWSSSENVAQLFDGNPGTPGEKSGTKLGGNGIKGTFDLTFSTAAPTVIHYYTLYTGNDTESSPGRNPIGWTLYGKKADGSWAQLDEVSSSESVKIGMEAKNATPYTYKVGNPGSYSDYKLTFRCSGGVFQMNELVLFNDPAGGTGTIPPQDTEQPPAQTQPGTDAPTVPGGTANQPPQTAPGTQTPAPDSGTKPAPSTTAPSGESKDSPFKVLDTLAIILVVAAVAAVGVAAAVILTQNKGKKK